MPTISNQFNDLETGDIECPSSNCDVEIVQQSEIRGSF